MTARNRAGEWVRVRDTAEVQGRPSGYVVKAQLIDDGPTQFLVTELRRLLKDDRLIVQKLPHYPTDLLEIQFAVWLDEMNPGTVLLYAKSAERDREVRS